MNAVIILVPLALAACGSQPTVSADNASAAEVAAKVKAAGGKTMSLSPGRWESTLAIRQVDIPGLPPEVHAHMRQSLTNRTSASCQTPKQAKKPGAGFFGGMDRADCRYDHFTMSGGKLDARLMCGSAGGSTTITMRGTYTPDSIKVAMTTEAKGGPPGTMPAMSMAATIDSRRTGACTGKEGRRPGDQRVAAPA